MEQNGYLKYLMSIDRVANTTRAEVARYMILPLLPAAGLLDLAYYLHSKRMFGPFERGWVVGLNAVGALILLSCGASLVITMLVKAGRRRLPIRLHRASDIVSVVLGFVLACGCGLYIMYRITQQYEVLETAALAKRGVTVVVPVEGRRFQGGMFSGHILSFRLPDARGAGLLRSVTYPDDRSVDTVRGVTVRYLPANPEIYRCVDSWHLTGSSD